jgi:hypothetical protein
MRIHCPCPHRPVDFLETYPDSCKQLADRIDYALKQYPSDIVFVHRDAEQRDQVAQREVEIAEAVASLSKSLATVKVIPVRMTEAWLLTDAQAIRCAVGNPNGTSELHLPHLRQLEAIDAKEALFGALVRAATLNRRRSSRLKPEAQRHRVVDYLEDLSRLRRLSSFVHFESQLEHLFSAGQIAHA